MHTAARPCYGKEEVASGRTAYRRLLAVEAGLRKYFGYVLNRKIDGHYNMRVDNGGVDDDGGFRCPPALRLKDDVGTGWRYKQCHYFMQDCIVAFLDEHDEAYPDGDVDATYVDGVWGPVVILGSCPLLDG